MLPQALKPALDAHIRTVQELLGHKDVSTTMHYTHVLNRAGLGVISPADTLPIPPPPNSVAPLT